jgi:predicted metal-dependent HD superfamily phosphohydrolase
MSTADALHGRWRLLWPRAAGEVVDDLYRDLVARYAEPHRAYHTLDHVAGCLHWLDEVRPLLARPNEVEWAIWFHDAVYDPRRADNEERSAALAAGALRAAGVGKDEVERVADLIRLTAHQTQTVDLKGDAALVCDIDLAILGAEPAAFDAYDDAIRREYAWVPEDIFRRERARVLAGFVARRRIYQTSHFNNALEQRARANLAATIQDYQNGTLMPLI